MALRRILAVLALVGCVAALSSSSATAAGEEIVVETGFLSQTQPFNWIDPAVSYSVSGWQVGYVTCLKLLYYNEETDVLAPDGATAMPAVSGDRKTYTFTLASGHAFSDGEPVSAASFKRAIERATSPTMATTPGGAPARNFIGDIVGAQDFFSGSAVEITGVQASGNTLTITLVAPASNFPHRVATNFFCATPSIAPAGFSEAPFPMAGPYYIASASSSEVVAVRNPHYPSPPTGHRLRNLGTIRFASHPSPLTEDYVAGAPLSYTPPAGATDLFNLTNGIFALHLKTIAAPFNVVDNRRAVAYAINRTALSAIRNWQPTDQFLSPLMPGAVDWSVYPLTGDATFAEDLLNGATPSVNLCYATGPGSLNPQVAAAAEIQLEAVGFVVTTVAYPQFQFFGSVVTDPNNDCHLSLVGWIPDFLDPSAVLPPLFEGGGPGNFSFFNDASYNARFASAGAEPSEALRLAAYAQLDRDLSGDAPAVAIGYIRDRAVFSDRMGCLNFTQAVVGYAINRLCIEVSEPAAPGETVSTGEEATSAAPLQTSVEVPLTGTGGDVTITQGQSTAAVPPEYTLLEQRLDISAPPQTPENPLVLTFELDTALLAGPPPLSVSDIVPLKNGEPVLDCTGPGATPDPCVALRTTQPDGDGEIVVRTSTASVWEFGERYDITGGFLRPVDNPPRVNSAKAGSTVPLKFSLGGDEGLAVFASGSPTSARGACPGAYPIIGAEEPIGSAGGALKYSSGTEQYHLNWKTSKAWAGTCRRLSLKFREGSRLSALFKFK